MKYREKILKLSVYLFLQRSKSLKMAKCMNIVKILSCIRQFLFLFLNINENRDQLE